MPKSIDKDNAEKQKPSQSADDPLATLSVFDRLEVGSVELEPKRLTAPYRLYRNGMEDPGIQKPHPFELSAAKPETELARTTPRTRG